MGKESLDAIVGNLWWWNEGVCDLYRDDLEQWKFYECNECGWLCYRHVLDQSACINMLKITFSVISHSGNWRSSFKKSIFKKKKIIKKSDFPFQLLLDLKGASLPVLSHYILSNRMCLVSPDSHGPTLYYVMTLGRLIYPSDVSQETQNHLGYYMAESNGKHIWLNSASKATWFYIASSCIDYPILLKWRRFRISRHSYSSI